MKLSLILDIDHQYGDFHPEVPHADLSGLSGVNGYCSEGAAGRFRKVIRGSGKDSVREGFSAGKSSETPLQDPAVSTPWSGIHLFGSGNYHYISKFFLETIAEPFNLLLIDNHPDMEVPAFPLLSCGSWVLDSLRELPNLQQVYMFGVRPDLFSECLAAGTGAPYQDRVTLLPLPETGTGRQKIDAGNGRADIRSEQVDTRQLNSVLAFRLPVPSDLPLYISIDKDALSQEYAVTDWDQGKLTLDNLCQFLSDVKGKRLLGADICGDSRAEADNPLNIASTEAILKLLG